MKTYNSRKEQAPRHLPGHNKISSALSFKDNRNLSSRQRQVAELMSRASPILMNPEKKIFQFKQLLQLKTNIDDSDWQTHHQGNIALGSGSEATVKKNVPIDTGMTAVVTEKDRNHFATGHTLTEFSFEDSNIDRSARSGFWPAGKGSDDTLTYAETALTSLKSDIKDAIPLNKTLNERSHKAGEFKYALTITTQADEEGETDDNGFPKSGQARLQQFYPISGTGFLYADKGDLYAVKKRLGK